MARKVGARGFAHDSEELMLDLMYHLPTREGEGIRSDPGNGGRTQRYTRHDGEGGVNCSAGPGRSGLVFVQGES